MFPSVIETDRLRLERFALDNLDVLSYYEVCSSAPGIEEMTEYVLWSPHDHPEESRAFVRDREEAWETREAADYVIRPKDPHPDVGPRVVPDVEYGPFAGQTGLQVDWDRLMGTLGLWLRKPFWGRGYSGERAAALFELAFEQLDLDLVAVTHHPDNNKSRRAIEKYVERFGGRREGELRNFIGGEDGPN
ncbi:MAG: GNAT family N-acetyltransferase, partial [Halobacteriales archaeon]